MVHKSPTESRERGAPHTARTRQTAVRRESLAQLREEAAHCRDCPLWRNAAQTVFGEGAASANVVLIGEQPGDQEDVAGRPFVGPSGRLLDRALQQAGVDRKRTYVTNAVKHFKFEPRGKRRLHKKPNELEISACHQWLEREMQALNPDLVVALGATAARAVFGRTTAIGKNRGRIIDAETARAFANVDVLVTVHPSYLLRLRDDDRASAYSQFVADLRLAAPYT